MAIQFTCPRCTTVLSVPDGSAGGSARCPSCDSVLPVPAGADPLSGTNPLSAGAGAGAAAANPYNQAASGSAPMSNPYDQAPSNPYASPTSVAPDVPTYRGGIQPTAVDFGRIFSHAKEVWKTNLMLLLGMIVIIWVVSLGFNIVTSLLDVAAQEQNTPVLSIASGLIGLIGSIFNTFLGIGAARIGLAAVRRQPVSMGMLFSGTDCLLPVIGGSILYGLGALVGFLLLIIPGFIFLILTWTYYYLLVDRQGGVFESFGNAYAIGKLNWGTSIVMGVASFLIMILGLLALGIGLLFAAPLVAVLWATGYTMMKGENVDGNPAMTGY